VSEREIKPLHGLDPRARNERLRDEIARMADEAHAVHGAQYLQHLEARDRERTLRARAARAAAAIARRLGVIR
jgi:hypothetical protein